MPVADDNRQQVGHRRLPQRVMDEWLVNACDACSWPQSSPVRKEARRSLSEPAGGLTARVIGSLGMPPSRVEGCGFGARAAPRACAAHDIPHQEPVTFLEKLHYSWVRSQKVTHTLLSFRRTQ